METIFALCSASGKAGVAVIRISGPKAWDATRSLCVTLPEPRKLALRVLRDTSDKRLDERSWCVLRRIRVLLAKIFASCIPTGVRR